MSCSPAIVVMIDGLRARSLGVYGNTGYQTPAFDRIASQGVVFDRCLAESVDLMSVYKSLWTGEHAIASTESNSESRHLIRSLIDADYLCHLLTDEATLAQSELAEAFDEVTLLDAASTEPAEHVFETSIGRVMAEAAKIVGGWSSEYEQPRLLWIHLQGLLAPWDAPTELAETLLDEDDPELTPNISVPTGQVTSDEAGDDEAFLASCRYAGQVMALDQCLGALDDLLAELWPETPLTTIVAGTRGFALGEHRTLGLAGQPHSELFHTPLLIRGDGVPSLQRRNNLLQSSDLNNLLLALLTEQRLIAPERTLAVGEVDSAMFVQTDDWHFVTDSKLYVKPDDLWEANDVASRCATELEYFQSLTTEIQERAKRGEPWHDLLATHASNDTASA